MTTVETGSPSGTATAAMLVLRAGARICAVPLGHVTEVMRPLPIDPLSGAPAFVSGLAPIRGKVTPVVDLDALLSGRGAATPTAAARLVSLHVGDRGIALQVDEVIAIRVLDPTHLAALPPLWQGPQSPAIAALAALDREVLLVLETARLLPPDAVPAGPRTPSR